MSWSVRHKLDIVSQRTSTDVSGRRPALLFHSSAVDSEAGGHRGCCSWCEICHCIPEHVQLPARKYGHARLSISTREPIGQSRNTKLVKTRPSHIHVLPVRVRLNWNLDNEAGAFYAIHVPLQLFSH